MCPRATHRAVPGLLAALLALAAPLGLWAAEAEEKEAPKEGEKGQPAPALTILGYRGSLYVQSRKGFDVDVGDWFEVRREKDIFGYGYVSEFVSDMPKLQIVVGHGRHKDELAPLATQARNVILYTDDPTGSDGFNEAKELQALCGRKLRIAPLGDKMDRPARKEVVVGIVHQRGHFMMGDPIITPHIRAGGTAVLDFQLYAELKVQEAFEPKLKGPAALRIVGASPLTAGFAPEDRLPWYGMERKKHVARYWTGLFKSDAPQKALATDETTRNAALFEEGEEGKGRTVVLDLISPNARAGRDPGSKNKWLFLSRLLGTGPRYSRYYAARPSRDDMLGWFEALAKDNSDRLIKTFEGGGAEKEDYIYSYTFGPKDKPQVVLVSGVEGQKWLGPCALLGLADTLLNNPDREPRIDWLLSRLRIKIVPVLNLYGYTKDTPVNRRKVELERNFPYAWDDYADLKGRGTAPISEAETILLKRVVEDQKAVGLLEIDSDGYDPGYRIVRGRDLSESQQLLIRAMRSLLNCRLAGRALVNGDQPLRLKLFRDANRPSAINWAASKGILAACVKICGDGEDSLVNNDVAIESALAFLALTAVSLEKPPPPPEPAPAETPRKAPKSPKKAAE